MRNYLVPLGALLVLLVQAMRISVDTDPVRVVATVFGVRSCWCALSGTNATLFQGAPAGTWRKRVPSIFLDVARFALIAVGLGLILAYIWGANVGGLFAALGVTSIVLGLALQNSVGQIISGLFVLFEQPFVLGDWIQTPTAAGRVLEVNWRATHIDTGGGLLIVPNSVLAAAPFTNFSRPPGTHRLTVTTQFAVDDPPDEVIATLNRVAAALPQPSTRCRARVGRRRRAGLHDVDTAARPCRRRRREIRVPALDLVCLAAGRLAPRRGRGRLRDPGAGGSSALEVLATTLRLNPAEREELAPHAAAGPVRHRGVPANPR